MRKLLALWLVASIVALTGCNTMQGLGKDIDQLGDKIQKKSQ